MTKVNTPTAFQMKADMFPITVLVLRDTALDAIEIQLNQLTQKAPSYFKKAPVVIDASNIEDPSTNLPGILSLLRSKDMYPVGVRGIDASIQDTIELPILKGKASEPQPQATHNVQSTRLITKPVRAGSKIYAKNADLIIVGPVNVGAEVIADGNIHVYGPLRGRALAGASGNTEARIFCQHLDAELIAIAGHYQVSENLQRPENNGQVIQIFLSDNTLNITHT